MSYFGRLIQQSGLAVAEAGRSGTLGPKTGRFETMAPAQEMVPLDLPEVEELVEVADAGPPPPTSTSAIGETQHVHAASPEPRLQDRDPRNEPPLQSSAPAETGIPELPNPVREASPASTPATSTRPEPGQEPLAEPAPSSHEETLLIRHALQWVASGPDQAPVKSAKEASPIIEAAPASPVASRATAVVDPSQRPATRDGGDERPPASRPSAMTAEASPAHGLIHEEPLLLAPTPSPTRGTRPVRPAEAEVGEVVQVSIGSIHVRVETPNLSAMPTPAQPALPPAPARQPQAARLGRRYLHP